MFEILLFFLIGTALGIITGLVPGLHPNTIFVLMLSLSWLSGTPSIYSLLSLVVSMAVTNTIVNFIPSIFFGAPEAGTSLSVLPGHRFLLRGEGYQALFLTVVGGVYVTLLTAAALPFLLWFIPFLYSTLHMYIHILLLITLSVLLYRESGTKKLYSLLIFLVSGASGLLLLSALPSGCVLFPAFSGLFGLSILITGCIGRTTFPRQKKRRRIRCSPLKGALAGWLSGMLVGILPGIGSAQAGVLTGAILKSKEKDFLVALGGINTANIIFTFIALHALSKTRSGATAFVSEFVTSLGINEIVFIVLVSILSCFVSAAVTLFVGKRSLSRLSTIEYHKQGGHSSNFRTCPLLFRNSRTRNSVPVHCNRTFMRSSRREANVPNGIFNAPHDSLFLRIIPRPAHFHMNVQPHTTC
jgi:putative membrane protein